MTVMLDDIKNKKKAVPSEELIALRGDIENDKPYWADTYTAAEWQSRKAFELRGTEEETYSGQIGLGDLSDFDTETKGAFFSGKS